MRLPERLEELVSFIEDRLEEDYRSALKPAHGPWRWDHGTGAMCNDKDCPYGYLMSAEDNTVLMEVHGYDVHMDWQGAEHIARWDPTRVLRDTKAKRQILKELSAVWKSAATTVDSTSRYLIQSGLDVMLRQMASIWSDHPSYRPWWGLPI